jgi:hypothetical protein
VPRQPRSDQLEGERIRVCNFCLKQREEALTGSGRNENGEGYLMLSPSLSSVSMESSKTSSTGQTLSTLTGGSASGSNANDQNYDSAGGEYLRFDQAIGTSACPEMVGRFDQAVGTDACPEMEGLFESGKVEKDTETLCDHYECRLNRHAQYFLGFISFQLKFF